MQKSRLWALIAALALVIATVGLAACGSSDDDTTGGGDDNGSGITSVKDLAGKNVAAQNGTTGLDYAKTKTDAKNVQGFPQGPDVANAVQAGQVDAGILDQPVAQDALDNGAPIEIAAVIPTGELYGIGVPKDNPNLLAAINEQLASLKKDGTLDDLYQKYFNIDAPDQVLNGTTTNPGSKPGDASGDLGLAKDGTLTVGSDIPYPPFESSKAPDYTGFDVDVLNAVAEGLGVEAKFQDTSFDTIFADLAANKFDVVASAATITPDRQKQVNFSDPYYSADQALIVPKG